MDVIHDNATYSIIAVTLASGSRPPVGSLGTSKPCPCIARTERLNALRIYASLKQYSDPLPRYLEPSFFMGLCLDAEEWGKMSRLKKLAKTINGMGGLARGKKPRSPGRYRLRRRSPLKKKYWVKPRYINTDEAAFYYLMFAAKLWTGNNFGLVCFGSWFKIREKSQFAAWFGFAGTWIRFKPVQLI